ncbi:MAG: hypothetical protein ABIB04_04610 [Patescibacteria group bacterium]
MRNNSLELISFITGVMSRMNIRSRLAIARSDPLKLVRQNHDMGVMLVEKGESLPEDIQKALLQYQEIHLRILVPLLRTPDTSAWGRDFTKLCSPPKKWPSWVCRMPDWLALIQGMLQRLHLKHQGYPPLNESVYHFLYTVRFRGTDQIYALLIKGFENFKRDKSRPSEIMASHIIDLNEGTSPAK